MACSSYELAYCGGVSLDDNIPCDVDAMLALLQTSKTICD